MAFDIFFRCADIEKIQRSLPFFALPLRELSVVDRVHAKLLRNTGGRSAGIFTARRGRLACMLCFTRGRFVAGKLPPHGAVLECDHRIGYSRIDQ